MVISRSMFSFQVFKIGVGSFLFPCVLVYSLVNHKCPLQAQCLQKDGKGEDVLRHHLLRFPPGLPWGDLTERDRSLPHLSTRGRVRCALWEIVPQLCTCVGSVQQDPPRPLEICPRLTTHTRVTFLECVAATQSSLTNLSPNTSLQNWNTESKRKRRKTKPKL